MNSEKPADLSSATSARIPAPEKKSIPGGLPHILYFLVAVVFLSMWHMRATHGFSPKAVLVFAMLCGAFLIYGRVFFRLTSFCLNIIPGIPAEFLCGYFILNTLGFVMAFLTHLTIASCILILSFCALPALLIRPRNADLASASVPDKSAFLPQILCLILSGVGATLWCADSLHPAVNYGQFTTYQTWIDSFFHTREISIFAQSHGLREISNIQMSDAPASIYHYASYVVPAAISSLSGTHSYEVFASFQIPFGIMLTGLAAFTLMSAVWGAWPGLVAVIAVLFLPDAYQQGFQNKFMGYNFLQQVNPGGLYGVALVSLAWMFMLNGCKTGRLAAIFFSYAILMVSVVYKAQLFVANSFLLMIYPCIFFHGIKGRWRAVVTVVMMGIFLLVVHFSQYSSSIPTLRLDGSSTKHYALLILKSFDEGLFKGFYYWQLTGEPPAIFDMIMAVMIIACTFGFWIVACILIFFLLRAKADNAARFFPLLVIMNYIIMAVGLAGDKKGIGMPEELSHRPLVWAYFAVVAWTGAAVYFQLAGSGPPKTSPSRILAAILVLAGAILPFMMGRNIQTMPAWPGYGDYRMFNSLRTGYVEATSYLNKHSAQGDIIQDSENDPRLSFTALTERQDFVAHGEGNIELRVPEGLKERVKEMEAFKNLTTEAEVIEFARKNRISWYLIRPETHISWPPAVIASPAFESGGYRVYHFSM